MKHRILGGVATAAILLFVGQTYALAQETSETDAPKTQTKRLDTVVTTAQKREQNLQDVPLSVSAVTGEQLEERGISAVADLSQISPSLTYSQSTNPQNSSIRIRGIGTSVFSPTVEPSVSFVVDGVVLARQGQAFMDLIDIDRVEVLRGPQSTLFGKNASAGVISIVTKDASDKLEAVGEVTVAEKDEYQAKATISGPFADNVRGRLTGYYKDIGGHIDNVFDGRKLNGSESWGVRGKLQVDFTDRFDVQFIGDYGDADSACCMWQHRYLEDPLLLASIAPVVPSEANTQTNVDAEIRNTSEQWGASVQANYEFDAFRLTSITAHREWKFTNTIDIDGTPSQGLGPNYLLGGLFALDVNDNDNHLKQFSQEFRLTSKTTGPISYVVGAYMSKLDFDTHFERRICFINLGGDNCPATFQPFFPFSPFTLPGGRSGYTEQTTKNENLALFGQLDWAATDKLTATIGLRTLRDKLEFDYTIPYEPIPEYSADAITPVAAPAGFISAVTFGLDGPDNPNRSGNGVITDYYTTGKVALQYAFTDDINVYGSYSKGYKGPAANIGGDSDFLTVDPEISDAYEVGYRSILLDGRMTFNVTAFDVKYQDYQAQGFDPLTTSFRLLNVGKASTKGVEAELRVLATDNLILGLGGAYTDAKYDSFQNAACYVNDPDPDCVGDNIKDLSGERFSNSPEWKFNANATYNLELDSMPFNMFFNGAYRWQDDTNYSGDGNLGTIQEAYGILDGSFGFVDKSGRYTLTIFGKNLLDQEFAGMIFQDPIRTDTTNLDQYIPKAAERYFGITLRAKY